MRVRSEARVTVSYGTSLMYANMISMAKDTNFYALLRTNNKMDLDTSHVVFTIALTQATRMGTEDLVLPDWRGAPGRMTADATEESCSGGESPRTHSRRRLEAQAALLLVDGSRRRFASARGAMTLLMGE